MASNHFSRKKSFGKTTMKHQQGNENDSFSTNNNENNVLVSNLLTKLRPFQREAYEFATQGKISERLQKHSAAPPPLAKSSKRKASASSSSSSNQSFSYDPSYLGKGKILLADEMGLGKTVTSLAIMAHYKDEWPLLVLCPASLRHTWPSEIEKFLPTISPSSIYVLNGFNDVNFVSRLNEGKIQVVVATYSLLQHRSAVAQLFISSLLNFKCVIADESHNLKTWNSQRCKIAMPILTKAERLVLLSGTPALARPVELYSQVHVLAPKLFGNYTNYTKRYCDPKFKFGRRDVTGLSNPHELHANLRQIMIRRLKCDVLHELPAKQRMVVPIVKITDKALIKDNQELIQDLKDTRKSVSEMIDQGGGGSGADFEAKSLFMQAYQASGIIKAQAVADYLVDWIAGSGTQKVLIFAHHKAVMDTLELAISKHLKGVGHIRIDGSVAANDRAKLVRKFQTSAQVRIGLLSMTAAGVGLTLTAASTVMFAELHFTPGVLAQAEDRAHRIGQQNAVNIMYFVCKDPSISVDSQIWNMLGRKIGTLEQVIDGGTGKERAALAAKELNGNEANANMPRQSGQEELTSFFAETAAAGITSGKNKLPTVAVKGSILSFFNKSKDLPPSSSSTAATGTAKSNNTSVRNHSNSDFDKKFSPRSNEQGSINFATASPPSDEIIEWACQTCTFINSKKNKAYLACEMCNSMYIAGDFASNDTITTIGSENGKVPLVTPIQRSVPPQVTLSGQCQQTPVRDPPLLSTKKTSCTDDTIVIDEDPSWLSSQTSDDGSIQKKQKITTHQSSMTTRPSLPSVDQPAPTNAVILIDDDDTKMPSKTQNNANKRKRTSATEPVVVDLDADKEYGIAKTYKKLAAGIHPAFVQKATHEPTSYSHELLTFSVSQNSGRITLHYKKESNRSSFINFDINEVVTEETTNALEETQTKRSSAIPTPVSISFENDAIGKVIQKLDSTYLKSRTDRKQSCNEVKMFVSSYLSLRGIERKAIQTCGEPFSSKSLAQAAAKVISAQALEKRNQYGGGTTFSSSANAERYSGGAKERAEERLKEGTATSQDMAILQGQNCVWCGEAMSAASRKAKSVYCSQECAETGRIRRGGMFTSSMIRNQAFALEAGVCQLCNIDAHGLFLRIKALPPAQRLSVLCNVNWKLPMTHDALERLLQDPKEGSFWQVDHIKAVAEGGGSCGMDNLRTLCVPCHALETQKLRGRLKLTGGVGSSGEEEGTGKKKQLDIRSIFTTSR